MLKKIKQWRAKRRKVSDRYLGTTYTREQVEKAYVLGYNDGRKDGLAIAREQALKSLSEILKQQRR